MPGITTGFQNKAIQWNGKQVEGAALGLEGIFNRTAIKEQCKCQKSQWDYKARQCDCKHLEGVTMGLEAISIEMQSKCSRNARNHSRIAKQGNVIASIWKESQRGWKEFQLSYNGKARNCNGIQNKAMELQEITKLALKNVEWYAMFQFYTGHFAIILHPNFIFTDLFNFDARSFNSEF